ncbi:MAG: type II toxin-antitoxin system VapC family toxin [Chloroflexi bacterium]|nr:type II toxin-antitoxin system VapC family toxin [Chloroflexota bacterium]
MIVLDTTVLVYAKGADHPLRDPCRALIDAIGRKAIEASTTPEVIQEFAHVRARRDGRNGAVSDARGLVGTLSPLLLVDGTALTLGLRIYEETPVLGSFDAVLAAVAIVRSADALVSADHGFAAVKGLTHLDPAVPDFLERLGIA